MDIIWVNSGISRNGFDWEGGDGINPSTNTPFEAVIGRQNFKQIWWLEKALAAAKKVARVKLRGGSATGFMITEDILMTNNHVFENKAEANSAKIQFNYRMDISDNPSDPDNWECDGDSLFKTNPELDYSIVKLKPKGNTQAGKKWGHFNINGQARVRENQRVNIIQHPNGRFKEIAFRDNQVKSVGPNFVQYLTDTDYGSSGSPVLDDWFEVVALHNQRVSDPQSPYRWYRNQGYLMNTIYEEIKGHL